jgi:serine/threonine-protein phosphatase 2A activator
MLKMYNVEVLSKFPVVQHFNFGSLFRWDKDENAISTEPSLHASSQPSRVTSRGTGSSDSTTIPSSQLPLPPTGTAAPWATARALPPAAMTHGTNGPSLSLRGQPTATLGSGITAVRAPWAGKTETAPRDVSVSSPETDKKSSVVPDRKI